MKCQFYYNNENPSLGLGTTFDCNWIVVKIVLCLYFDGNKSKVLIPMEYWGRLIDVCTLSLKDNPSLQSRKYERNNYRKKYEQQKNKVTLKIDKVCCYYKHLRHCPSNFKRSKEDFHFNK